MCWRCCSLRWGLCRSSTQVLVLVSLGFAAVTVSSIGSSSSTRPLAPATTQALTDFGTALSACTLDLCEIDSHLLGQATHLPHYAGTACSSSTSSNLRSCQHARSSCTLTKVPRTTTLCNTQSEHNRQCLTWCRRWCGWRSCWRSCDRRGCSRGCRRCRGCSCCRC